MEPKKKPVGKTKQPVGKKKQSKQPVGKKKQSKQPVGKIIIEKDTVEEKVNETKYTDKVNLLVTKIKDQSLHYINK
uniref:Uncharacterized protein n=1 Tax=viral metagenome TaxID=1070528 RepID=A0A6C0I9S5_9ZZZZ